MANYSTTKASIDANVIPYNNAQLITGEKMNSVLKEIVDNMGGQGYLYKGIASPSDPAITTDARVFFFATEPGTYTNKGGVVVNSGELAIITYDTIWNKSVVCYGLTSTELAKLRNLPTVIELESALNGKVDKVTGKGLSSNDYTDADKAKLAGLEPVTISQNTQTGGYDIKVGDGTPVNVAAQIPELFLDSTQTVSSSATRNKSFNINAAGKNTIIVVSFVSGVSSESFNLYWVDGEGVSTTIATGIPMGKYSQVLSVPNDAVKLKVFIGNTGTSSTYSVRMYNADGTKWFIDQMNGLNALPYLNNRRVHTFDFDAQVSASTQWILSYTQGEGLNLSGEIYAAIITDAEFLSWGNAQGGIKFFSTGGVVPQYVVFGDELKSGKVFKIFSRSTLQAISIVGGDVVTAGHIKIVVFAAETADEYLSKPLKDARILCLGDSNTEFKHPSTYKRYSDYLAEISGAVTYNCGIGGSRLAQRETPSLTPADNQQAFAAFEIVSLCTAFASNDYSLQLASLNSGLLTSDQQEKMERVYNTLHNLSLNDVDIITINGGTNDYNGGNALGEKTIGNTDATTTIGAINTIVKVLLEAKPTLKLYFFEPIFGMSGTEVTWENSTDYYIPDDAPEGLSRPEWNVCLKEAVERNHIPYDAWYYTLGFNIYTFSTYYSDNHHAQRGYHIMAEKMLKFLLSN